jgi:hypothetical protein
MYRKKQAGLAIRSPDKADNLTSHSEEKLERSRENVDSKQRDVSSHSKDVDNSDHAENTPRNLLEDPKIVAYSPTKLHKSGFSPRSKSKGLFLDRSGDRTFNKTDIKKISSPFKEPLVRPLKQDRNEKSFEDFTGFVKIAPIVKEDSHEHAKVMDIDQICAEKIKQRYRSTDRFIRISQYEFTNLSSRKDLKRLDHEIKAFNYGSNMDKRIMSVRHQENHLNTCTTKIKPIDPVVEIKVSDGQPVYAQGGPSKAGRGAAQDRGKYQENPEHLQTGQ